MFYVSSGGRILRRILAATILMLAAAAPCTAYAEVTSPVLAINEEAATANLSVLALRGGVSVVSGSGGNIGVLATAEGKLIVDAGIAVSRPRLLLAINSISSAPPKYVINTHYHWDHTDGNAWLSEAGATVVAHENTLKRLRSGTRVIEWGFTFPPAPAAALPTVVLQNERTIELGRETVLLRHYGAGHTDGDVAVYFTQADVLQLGDIWWNGHYPFIDYGAGGSIDGLIRWVNACIEVATPRTIIIPGHGQVGDRTQLIAYRDMLVDVRRKTARLKKQGKTLAETVAARPTADYDAKWGDFVIYPAFFIQLVYMGV